MNSHTPWLDPRLAGPSSSLQKGVHEIWTFKVNAPQLNTALLLRFSVLVSRNGFQRTSEITATVSQRDVTKEVHKTALRISYDLSQYSFSPPGKLQMGDSGIEFDDSNGKTWGQIQSKGHTLKWNLNFKAPRPLQFNPIPRSLHQFRLSELRMETPAVDLSFDGTLELDGKLIVLQGAPGMHAHYSGSREILPLAWSHCNSFVNEKGQPSDFVFEALDLRPVLVGGLPALPVSTFFFCYRGVPYIFNTLWDSLWSISKRDLTHWTFQVDRGELSFRGSLQAEHKDFAGTPLEDTNGTVFYCAHSDLSHLEILVYNRGKIETTLTSSGAATFATRSTQPNPYVPLIL